VTALAPLTLARRHVLDAIRAYITEHGRPPSMSDLAVRCRLDRTTVRYHLLELASGGWIRREPGRARSIELVDAEAGTDIGEAARVPG
jgi:SOS-response transcriptional repressor LexA